MKIGVPHFIYRCYDTEGVLLYIGCTSHVKPRLQAHRGGSGTIKASRWLKVVMARYEVGARFPNKVDAHAAEAKAIFAEHPLFNIRHRDKSLGSFEARVSAYLISKGHGALAPTLPSGQNEVAA